MAPATKYKARPIERPPSHNGVPLPRNWGAIQGGMAYRPDDHEDWASVAYKFGVRIGDLIYFNFKTDRLDEVNWYLRHYTGCVKVNEQGTSWMFGHGASPGVIYIPPWPGAEAADADSGEEPRSDAE